MKNKTDSILNNYYKAYEKRYKQIYNINQLWSSEISTPDVLNTINVLEISKDSKILELGCGEGRDAINLLNKNYNVLAVDYSKTVINKCNELSNYKYRHNFKRFDILKDKINEKFDFIYSIAVLHMFITNEHRRKFLDFVYEHLKPNGYALIGTMGDGIKEFESDVNEAFVDKKRTILNSNKEVKIVSTSCKIVNWNVLKDEINSSKLLIYDKWISTDVPEFDKMMFVILKKET